MTAQILLTTGAVLLLVTGEAFAVKQRIQVTPTHLQITGFSVASQRLKGELLEFKITRDLSKAPSYGPESDLEVRRDATLDVRSGTASVVECQLAPNTQKKTLTYRFVIARDFVPHSLFTLAEIDDYKNTDGREHLIGGGTIYEFRLADFVGK